MTLKYSITSEYPVNAPQTVTGTVTASTVRACVGRAVKDALGQPGIKGTHWSSLVVLVERP